MVQTGQTDLGTPRVFVEFDDPTDRRRRFRCDLTWLTSSWTCIYGQGCKSIFAAVPEGGCCVIGAHFSGEADRDRVAVVVDRLDETLWQHHPGSTSVDAWSEVLTDGEVSVTKTRIVDGACIFLNRTGFGTGAGCAMHWLGEREGLDHVTVMPEACWQLPIRRADRFLEHPDGSSQVEVTITEYDRRSWGPGGHELDWFCTNAPEAHVGREPVFRSNRAELVALMGEEAYAELAVRADAHLAAVKAARAPGQRALLPLLVHPATLAAQATRPVPSSAPPPPPRKAKRRR